MISIIHESLIVIRDLGRAMSCLPLIGHKGISRYLALAFLQESRRAEELLHLLPLEQKAAQYVERELFPFSDIGYLYEKLIGMSSYVFQDAVNPDNKLFPWDILSEISRLLDLQDAFYEANRRFEKNIALLYADMPGTVAACQISDLYGLSLVLSYRQICLHTVKSFAGYGQIPMGDSIIAKFEEPENALKASLEMLKRMVRFPRLASPIGISWGRSLSTAKGTGQIGRDYCLSVKLSEKGQNFWIWCDNSQVNCGKSYVYLQTKSGDGYVKSEIDPIKYWPVVKNRPKRCVPSIWTSSIFMDKHELLNSLFNALGELNRNNPKYKFLLLRLEKVMIKDIGENKIYGIITLKNDN